ncbi:hypothetical protein GGR57DRAFT_451829 [Xylariaceae sp. FL1272]|nr:hypothetical protein GGR57DRAFT_451829 [Xylariaceae sp. FL1272]
MTSFWKRVLRRRTDGNRGTAPDGGAHDAPNISEYEGDNAGIKVLHDPGGSDVEVPIDIVFVHGLGGHREGTWAGTEPSTGVRIEWIRDLLPEDLPSARIITYGYDSDVTSALYLTQKVLYAHTKSLLTDLKRLREHSPAHNRPLMFVGHSLGGLVIKSALVQAIRAEEKFGDILRSITGICFFGTPHQETRYASWSELVTKIVDRHIDFHYMRNTLDSDLRCLQLLHEQYKTLAPYFHTFCLYEDGSAGEKSNDEILVPESAAIPEELLYESRSLSVLPLPTNHDDLVKFTSRSPQYERVISTFKYICDSTHIAHSRVRIQDILQDQPVSDFIDDDFIVLPSQVPTVTDTFVGRDVEISNLHQNIVDKIPATVVLTGPAGIGKSQLAMKYASRHGYQYTSVFWLSCHSRTAFHSSLTHIATQLRDHYIPQLRDHYIPQPRDRFIPYKSQADKEMPRMLQYLSFNGLINESGEVQSSPEAPQLLLRAILEWFEKKNNRDWLLLLDNLTGMRNLQEFGLSSFVRGHHNGRILITTQAEINSGHEIKMKLSGLDPGAATKLLCDTSNLAESTSYEELLLLARSIDFHPLALNEIGKHIRLSQLSIPVFHQMLDTELASLKPDPTVSESQTSFGISELQTPYEKALEMIFSRSYNALTAKAAHIINVIAYLSDEEVSFDVLGRCLCNNYSATEISNYLSALKMCSLIREDETLRTVSTHRVFSNWLKKSAHYAPSSYQRARLACEAVSTYLKSSGAYGMIDLLAYTPERCSLEEQILPAIEHCVGYIEVLSKQDIAWENWGYTCDRQGRHHLAQQFFAAATSVTKATMSSSITIHLKAMDISLGPNHVRTLSSAMSLALHYEQEGMFGEAEAFSRRVSFARAKTLGVHHALAWESSEVLGVILQNQGKYTQAKVLYTSLHDAVSKILGPYHVHSLRLLGQIAKLWSLERNCDEAEPIYDQVIRQMKEHLGEEHEQTIEMEACRKVNDNLKLAVSEKKDAFDSFWN